jgi:hypothetical protein
MPIDEGIEARLRLAYNAAINRNPDGIATALRDLSAPDTATLVALGIYVCGFIAADVYGPAPTGEDRAELAARIAAGESDWIDLGDVPTIARLLGGAATGDEQASLVVVCGAHLLSCYRAADQRWYQYLDEIWDAYEQA